MYRQSQTMIFTANRGYALTSSRTLLIRHFLSSNWKVVLATADDALSGLGQVHNAPVNRATTQKAKIVPWHASKKLDKTYLLTGLKNGAKDNP